MDQREAAKSVLGLIAAHNIAQNTLLNRSGYVTANLLVAGTLAAFGRVAGLSFNEMGLTPRVDRRDLRFSGFVIALTAGGSLAALAHRRTRRLLRDERARDTSREAIAHKTLIRFPIGTALFEEATFRGILPAVTGRSPATGDLISAWVFGLWHVIPTARALPGSPLGRDMTLAEKTRAVLAGSALTAFAGLALSGLRRRSGSIVLPWVVHSAFNTITYLAGVVAWRVSARRS